MIDAFISTAEVTTPARKLVRDLGH